MKFGSVANPGDIDFSLPKDHKDTARIFEKLKKDGNLKIYIGCAKWNKKDLKNFYPKGVKDELEYYSRQFNSIELNATFYRLFPKAQFEAWREKVPETFRFFPKLTQTISHRKRLLDNKPLIDEYLDHALLLKDTLGTIFLQMHDNFKPKDFDRVKDFLGNWPSEVPLAVEFRHTDWFNDPKIADELYALLEEKNITNILVDTAGRRDIMHMRLTTPEAFIRYVGANHPSDFDRLDAWVNRLESWAQNGIKQIDFFIHQNEERESTILSAHFIKKLNARLGLDLHVPQAPDGGDYILKLPL